MTSLPNWTSFLGSFIVDFECAIARWDGSNKYGHCFAVYFENCFVRVNWFVDFFVQCYSWEIASSVRTFAVQN